MATDVEVGQEPLPVSNRPSFRRGIRRGVYASRDFESRPLAEELRMMSQQAALSHTMDALEKGEIKPGQANVFMVQLMGVRVVEGSLPREVRKELMTAVKAGEIGHMKKDGMKPEVFFHKNAGADAAEIRTRRLESSINALRKVLG